MCTRYTGQRGSLRDENREIALPELPGTPKGIAALTAFLQDSGAFTFTGEEYTPKNTPLFEAEQEPPRGQGFSKKTSHEIPPHTPAESPSNTIALALPSAPQYNCHPRPHQPVRLTLHILIPYSYTTPI